MKMRTRGLLLVLLVLLLVAPEAFAYLDPGTGSIILQGLIAAVAAIVGYVGLFWHKVKAFFQRFGGKKPDSSKNESTEDDSAS